MTIQIDELNGHKIKIIQDDNYFLFSLDAILLAHFTKVRSNQQVIDLCAGNGVVGLLLSTKFSGGNIVQVELQKELSKLNEDSVKLNNLNERIQVINSDLAKVHKIVGHDQFDVVTINPPYFKTENQNLQKKNKNIAIARHEITTDLTQISKASNILLKSKGKVYMIHRPDRLDEIMDTFGKENLAINSLQFIYSKKDKNANMVVVEAIKNGNKGNFRILPPVVAHNDDGEYTDFIKDVYNEF